jgi:hypothetical protein
MERSPWPTDDQKYRDLGLTQPRSLRKTEDRLDRYDVSPVRPPTRASLMTGSYATSIDYDLTAATPMRFFVTGPYKMHRAAHGHKVAELPLEHRW